MRHAGQTTGDCGVLDNPATLVASVTIINHPPFPRPPEKILPNFSAWKASPKKGEPDWRVSCERLLRDERRRRTWPGPLVGALGPCLRPSRRRRGL